MTTDTPAPAATEEEPEFRISGLGWWAIGGALGTAITVAAAFVVLMGLTGTPDYVAPEEAAGFAALAPEDIPAAAAAGETLARSLGCRGCHTTNGDPGIGPTWLGIWGAEEMLEDGSTATVDADYVLESIMNPGARVVAGFTPSMPSFDLTDSEIAELTAFISTLG